MKKNRVRSRFQNPSMVPLADMLTNTVGIMLFILIFTVLTATSAVIPKELPMEKETKSKPLYYICIENKIISSELGLLKSRFLNDIPELNILGLNSWLRIYNTKSIESEDIIVTGEGNVDIKEIQNRMVSSHRLSVIFTPKKNVGEKINDLDSPLSSFRKSLNKKNPETHYLALLVFPDSIDIFEKVRKIASENKFTVGWTPWTFDKQIRMIVSEDNVENTDSGTVIVPQ